MPPNLPLPSSQSLPDPPSCRHIASAEGAFSVVQWLLEEGVDVNCIDRHNKTPLEVGTSCT